MITEHCSLQLDRVLPQWDSRFTCALKSVCTSSNPIPTSQGTGINGEHLRLLRTCDKYSRRATQHAISDVVEYVIMAMLWDDMDHVTTVALLYYRVLCTDLPDCCPDYNSKETERFNRSHNHDWYIIVLSLFGD